jgi:outer membrane receptor protein involved in Fe transport
MINVRLKRAVVAAALCGAGMGGAMAQDGVDLGKITVKGEGMREADRSFSITTVGSDTIRSRSWDQSLRIIEEVPGLDLGAYQQGGIADEFDIRGFTTGGHGSDAAITLDGIMLNEGESHADGYADTNSIIPLEIESLTVMKGPVSPLYGNYARGGVLAYTTRKGGNYTDAYLAGGMFKTFDGQAAIGREIGQLKLNLAFQAADSEGWRDNSRYTKSIASARVGYDLSDRSEIVLSMRGYGGQWDASGYIPEEQFRDEDRRRQQATNGENDGGQKQYYTQRLDWFHDISDDLRLLMFLYHTSNDFTRYAKFGTAPGGQTEREYSRNAIAAGGSLNGQRDVMGIPSTWVAGFEYYTEETDWLRWNTSNRVRINQTEDRVFKSQTASIYGQIDLDVHPLFRPTLGFRYDKFDGSYDNRDPGGTPFSQDMNSYDHISPKLGARSAIHDNWELRGSIANGFGLPDGPQKFDPNLDVDTINYWQYEVGINGTPSPQWYVDAAYYILDSSDEIQEVPPGSSVFRNAGKTRRSGLEGEIRYFPEQIANFSISAVFAFQDSEVRSNADPSLEGKRITGSPKHITTVSLNYAPPTGWGGTLSWRSIGASWLDETNTVEYEGYDVVNASIFYNFALDEGRRARWFLDINNLTDETYSEAAFTDMFSPRPPINFLTGVSMSL